MNLPAASGRGIMMDYKISLYAASGGEFIPRPPTGGLKQIFVGYYNELVLLLPTQMGNLHEKECNFKSFILNLTSANWRTDRF